jgi:hypothetical protein
MVGRSGEELSIGVVRTSSAVESTESAFREDFSFSPFLIEGIKLDNHLVIGCSTRNNNLISKEVGNRSEEASSMIALKP